VIPPAGRPNRDPPGVEAEPRAPDRNRTEVLGPRPATVPVPTASAAMTCAIPAACAHRPAEAAETSLRASPLRSPLLRTPPPGGLPQPIRPGPALPPAFGPVPPGAGKADARPTPPPSASPRDGGPGMRKGPGNPGPSVRPAGGGPRRIVGLPGPPAGAPVRW
jgi:hypothetical protein